MPRGRASEYLLRSQVRDGGIIGFQFTTDGTGVPTLTDDYDGLVSIAQATNTYTITFGAVGAIKTVVVSQSLNATVNHVTTFSASAGTAIIAFSTDFDSATCDVIVLFSETHFG